MFRLSNGLTVIVHEDHSAPIVSVNTWYHVGSGRETPGRTGFVIGKKALRSAVARNRVRRILRAVVQAARPETLAFDVILRLKRGCTRDEIGAVAAEARALLAALVADEARGEPR